ncbi:MAG: tetratricopeptide repeat protein [Nitrospirae bacterium]|uniref:tetratricopeptide repeat protein n=1 Tax=Candidatus Magnetobacterium casense TaxID=1455061 RepID=UPI00058DA43F|nr:tetratricopeptide repeat protein [Candidatus Magnetobacterium casensis]MBF0337978.1 tetratricopeptide repeat protein [Nitrospirota bacterium]
MYIKYGYGNPLLLEWLDVIAKDKGKYDQCDIEPKLQGKQEEFIHKYLADVIEWTEGTEFQKFIQKAAVYREAVDATAFEAFGGAKFLNTGVDLTLLEREELGRGEFVCWVTPVIRESMWGKLTPYERDAMHEHAYQWYDSWISEADEQNYKYIEEAVHHALELGNIRGACKHAFAFGQYFDRMVLYREGSALMEKVADRVSDAVIAEAKVKKDINVGNFLNEYATSLWKLGYAKQAIEFYQKALDIWLAIYGEKHPHIAQSYKNLAGVCLKTVRILKAIKYFIKSKKAWP